MRIRATLKVKLDGGRKNPILSSYRPTFRFGFDNQSDCEVIVISGYSIKPGDTGVVEILILHPENIGNIRVYDNFTLTEGLKEVAKGSVIYILD